MSPQWPPLFHEAGEAEPSQESGRWHRKGEHYAQYLSLSPHGAWAEVVRYFGFRDADQVAEIRRNLWLVLVDETNIADLATFDSWRESGIDTALAVGDHGLCQQLADDLRDEGYRGVLSPSAALPGTVNLTLFGERYELLLRGAPQELNNPDPQLWLPCELTAHRAAPPDELIMATCFRGMTHLGHERWVARQASR